MLYLNTSISCEVSNNTLCKDQAGQPNRSVSITDLTQSCFLPSAEQHFEVTRMKGCSVSGSLGALVQMSQRSDSSLTRAGTCCRDARL